VSSTTRQKTSKIPPKHVKNKQANHHHPESFYFYLHSEEKRSEYWAKRCMGKGENVGKIQRLKQNAGLRPIYGRALEMCYA